MRQKIFSFLYKINLFFGRPPHFLDVLLLSVFAILITYQPYILYGFIDIVELGIYLPGIDAFLSGAVPYRDFIHLRGPLEIYIPGLLCKIFGVQLSVIYMYFYVGTVITLILCILIGRELYRTRMVLYFMTIIILGKTFPRVVYYMWGGMRYGWGILAILFCVYFFKKRRVLFVYLSGVVTSIALLTSTEIGICSGAGVLGSLGFAYLVRLRTLDEVMKAGSYYLFGILSVLGPFFIYLYMNGALAAYMDTAYIVATRMIKVFPDYLLGGHDEHIGGLLLHMFTPGSTYFKYLTPAYCYLFLVCYLIWQARAKKLNDIHLCVVSIACYGFVMYIMSFRKLGAAQTEMALQPEKMLLFFMCERAYFFMIAKKHAWRSLKDHVPRRKRIMAKIYVIDFLILAFIMSSVCTAFQRYDKRYVSYQLAKGVLYGEDITQLVPLYDQPAQKIKEGRAKGNVVPKWQAEDIKQLKRFFQKHTDEDEAVLMFPEYGSFNFLIDRPFVGRFPQITFSWMSESWYDEIFETIKRNPPRYVTVPIEVEETLEKYLALDINRVKYEQMHDYILENYSLVKTTPTQNIYEFNQISRLSEF